MECLPERGINQEVHQHDAAGPQTEAVKVCGQKKHCTMGRNATGSETLLSGIPVLRRVHIADIRILCWLRAALG
jgi:hypothetical protein